MDELMIRCATAYEDTRNYRYARFAFTMIAYKEGATYRQIADYLNLGNHSSAIYYKRRGEQLLEEKNEEFVKGWHRLGNRDERMEQAINVATSNILEYLERESDPIKRFNFLRFTLQGFANIPTTLQRCCNNVPATLQRCTNNVEIVTKYDKNTPK